jgi:hypothetical protein
MDNLPTEMILLILKYTDYDTRKSMCKVDKKIFNICKKYKKYLQLNDVEQFLKTGNITIEGVCIYVKIKNITNPTRRIDYEWEIDVYIKPNNLKGKLLYWFHNHKNFFKNLDNKLNKKKTILKAWYVDGQIRRIISSGLDLEEGLKLIEMNYKSNF